MHMAQPTLALLLIGLPLTLTIPHTGVAAERPTSNDGVVWVYVGTYTKTPDAGINFLAFDLATGKLTQPVVVAPTPNPSFLALNRRKPVLYAINEVSELAGRPGGVVRAYAVQPKSGQLAILNQQSSGGPGPCHVNVDQTGRTVLVANYSGGSVASFPLRPDGSLAPAATIDHHHGSSVNPSRQTGPFAHCVEVDPANRFVLSADLGIDKVMIYRLDAATGSLAPNQPANVDTARGAGPRHIAFHPNGQFVFVVNELDSTIGVFRYDGIKAGCKRYSGYPHYREALRARAPPPRFRFIRRAVSCTPRTADTIASRSLPSIPVPEPSAAWATNRPLAKAPGTLPSIPVDTTCWPRTRRAGMSSFFASIRNQACSSRLVFRRLFPCPFA